MGNARELAVRPKRDRDLAAELPLSILIVEDNPVNQKVVEMMLQKLGYVAEMVGNGLEAIHAVRDGAFDVVLMDVQMPIMDGLTATRTIIAEHSEERRPTIIAMTANAMVEDYDACLDAGMDDYIAKPLRIDQLESALERAVRCDPSTP